MLLLVDDEEGLRRGLAGFLRNRGYLVREAGGVAAALSIVNQEIPDCVVTDLNMDDGSGLDLAAWIGAKDWQTRVILMTGYADKSLLQGNLPKGVDQVLEKPLRPRVLLKILAEHGVEAKKASPASSGFSFPEQQETQAARDRRELREALWTGDLSGNG